MTRVHVDRPGVDWAGIVAAQQAGYPPPVNVTLLYPLGLVPVSFREHVAYMQRRQDELIRLRYQAEREQRQREHKETEDRIHATLLAVLSENQQVEYAVAGQFTAHGSQGGLYQVQHGYSGNIRRLPNGPRFCAHPLYMEQYPEAAMIAQLLTLATNEEAFLDVAILCG